MGYFAEFLLTTLKTGDVEWNDTVFSGTTNQELTDWILDKYGKENVKEIKKCTQDYLMGVTYSHTIYSNEGGENSE